MRNELPTIWLLSFTTPHSGVRRGTIWWIRQLSYTGSGLGRSVSHRSGRLQILEILVDLVFDCLTTCVVELIFTTLSVTGTLPRLRQQCAIHTVVASPV